MNFPYQVILLRGDREAVSFSHETKAAAQRRANELCRLYNCNMYEDHPKGAGRLLDFIVNANSYHGG